MKTVRQTWLLVIVLALSTLSAVFLMSRISPHKAGFFYVGTLYLTVFISASSLASLAGYYFRAAFWKKGSPYSFLTTAKRQGALLGFFAVAALLLKSNAILGLWTALSLFIIFALLEFYAVSR